MKKAVAAMLALLAALLLCVSVYAFVPQNIKSLRKVFASRLYDITLDGESLDVSSLTQIAARPSSELEIALVGTGADADLFLDQQGIPVNTADVTISKMRAAGITAGAELVLGGDIFEDVELSVRNAGTSAAKPVIKLQFPSEYTSLEPMPFSASVWISFGGMPQDESRLELSGTFGRLEVEVSAEDVTVSADSAVLFAREDIPLILIDAGAGVTAEASMTAGGRYLVAASPSKDAYDLFLIAERSGVIDVLKLNASGFEPGQIISVVIESEQVLQAYGENGVLLGNTSQKLPYSEKYYLAEKAVQFY